MAQAECLANRRLRHACIRYASRIQADTPKQAKRTFRTALSWRMSLGTTVSAAISSSVLASAIARVCSQMCNRICRSAARAEDPAFVGWGGRGTNYYHAPAQYTLELISSSYSFCLPSTRSPLPPEEPHTARQSLLMCSTTVVTSEDLSAHNRGSTGRDGRLQSEEGKLRGKHTYLARVPDRSTR
eukprot:3803062-Rhodomonas_salina.1